MAFRCEKCGGEFESQQRVDAHAREEHGASEGGHICAACGMAFGSREELATHAEAEHAA